IAALRTVLYLAVMFLRTLFPGDAAAALPQAPPLGTWVWLQLILFAVVALGTAYLSEQLRRGGEGTRLLAAHLEQVRLRAEDILRNINSGIITIDPAGSLVYANPMADQILGLLMSLDTSKVV